LRCQEGATLSSFVGGIALQRIPEASSYWQDQQMMACSLEIALQFGVFLLILVIKPVIDYQPKVRFVSIGLNQTQIFSCL
jgi:hypothetical protein